MTPERAKIGGGGMMRVIFSAAPVFRSSAADVFEASGDKVKQPFHDGPKKHEKSTHEKLSEHPPTTP